MQVLLLLLVTARGWRRMRLRQWVGAARRAAHGGGGLKALTSAGVRSAPRQQLGCVLQAAIGQGGFWRACVFTTWGPCVGCCEFSTEI